MPALSKITITQFKNYDVATFNFIERIVGICGLNGKGKTNLLDAIYYLCFTKSYFTKTDLLNISFGKDGFRLEGMFGNDRVVCIHRGAGKKEFYLNDIEYNKFSEHIGKLPVVVIAPDDVKLVTGSSEERRFFLDTLISQVDAFYLQQLIIYSKVLQQRNGLLKRFAEGNTDWTLLDILDEQLIQPGNFIHRRRKECMEQLTVLAQKFYRQIAGEEEMVSLQYESQLNITDFYSLLNQYREKDFILLRSNGGVHRDDIQMLLNGQPFKTTASQGQRKSLLFALKLAEFELLKTGKGFSPLLLLDDVFEKLDDIRMNQLLHWVCNENEGQVFITDTHCDRLENVLKTIGAKHQVIELR